MIVINTVSNERFSLNGIEYLKNFLSFVSGDKVAIYNAYDKNDQRINLDHYSNFQVNGTVYGSAALLQSGLLSVIYTRDTLGSIVNGLKGSIIPTSTPAGTGTAYWFATQAGTYTNFGGVVVAVNSFAVISRDVAGAFSISQTTLDITSKVNVLDVVNNLTSTETAKPLSAAQGKILNEKFNSYATDAEVAVIQANLNTSISSLASGSPKGTYTNLAALQAAFPSGNTNIYVTSNDGHWHYYNAGWQDGGVYQSPLTTTIKSNEALSLAQRKGDVLHGILDQFTGEEITLSKIITTPPVVDNIIYFQYGIEYFKRNFGSSVNPMWWGVKGDGVTDDIVPINAMLDTFGKLETRFQTGENKVFEFPSGKTYLVSNTINFWGRQTLNFNYSKVKSTTTGSVVAKKLISGTLFTAYGVKIDKLFIETNTASIGVSFFGSNESFLTETTINFETKANDIIGVLLKHGSGSEQCYANTIQNTHVQIYGGRASSETPTYGLMLTGTPGVSGTNINRILGGSYGGRVTYPIFISDSNNHVGNVFRDVDIEGWDTKDDNGTAVTCKSSLNFFDNLHIENYTNVFNLTGNFNNIYNLSIAVAGGVLDSGISNSVFGYSGNSGTTVLSLGSAKDVPTSVGTKLRIANDINTGFRMDIINSINESSRNFGFKVDGVGAGDFTFRRSLIKGGDPLDTDSEILYSLDYLKRFKAEKFISTAIDTKDRDSQNALINGFFYKTTLGEVRSLGTEWIKHREYDASTTQFTPSTINSAYPDTRTGSQIYQFNLGLLYTKYGNSNASGAWYVQPFSTLSTTTELNNIDYGKKKSGTTAQRPTVTTIGYSYFDITLSREIYWNGSSWYDLLNSPNFLGSVTSPQYKLSALNTAPISATDTGVLGEIRYDANYMYVCVSTNTWKRSALTTW